MPFLHCPVQQHECNTFNLSVTNPGSVSALCVELHRPTQSEVPLQFITQHLVLVTCTGLFPLDPQRADEKMNKQKPKTHISLGAPVSASLVSCAVLSGCRPCLSPSPALPCWAGIRSPGMGSGSDPGSCPLPGRRTGLWGSHSPLPSSPVWGSRRRTSCLCARLLLHCWPVPWTAYPPLCSCCQRQHCLWECHSSQPAGRGRGGWNVNILAIDQRLEIIIAVAVCYSLMFRRCTTLLCLSAVISYHWIYCSWLCNKQNHSGITTNHPACLKKCNLS